MKTIYYILILHFINFEFINAMDTQGGVAGGSGLPPRPPGGSGLPPRPPGGSRQPPSASGKHGRPRKKATVQLSRLRIMSGADVQQNEQNPQNVQPTTNPANELFNSSTAPILHSNAFRESPVPNTLICTAENCNKLITVNATEGNEYGWVDNLRHHLVNNHKDTPQHESYQKKVEEQKKLYSSIHEHYDKINDDSYQCKTCPNVIKSKGGAVTNLSKHLDTNGHKEAFTEYRNSVAGATEIYLGPRATTNRVFQELQNEVASLRSQQISGGSSSRKTYGFKRKYSKSQSLGSRKISRQTAKNVAAESAPVPSSPSINFGVTPDEIASFLNEHPTPSALQGESQQIQKQPHGSSDQPQQQYGPGSQQQRPHLSEQSLAEQQQMPSFSGQQQQQTGLELVQDIARTFRDVNPSALLQTGQQTAQQIPVTQHMMQHLSVSESQQQHGLGSTSPQLQQGPLSQQTVAHQIASSTAAAGQQTQSPATMSAARPSGNLSGMLTGTQQRLTAADKGKGVVDESQPQPQTQRRSTVGGLMPDARRTGTYPVGYEPPIPRRSTQQATQPGHMISFGTGRGTMPPPTSISRGGRTQQTPSYRAPGSGHTPRRSVSSGLQQPQTYGAPGGIRHASQAPSHNIRVTQHEPTQQQQQPSRLDSASVFELIAQPSVDLLTQYRLGQLGSVQHTPLRSLSRTMQQHQTFGTPGGTGHPPQVPSTQHQPSRLSISRQIAAQQSVPVPSLPSLGESMIEIARQLHEENEVQSVPQRGAQQQQRSQQSAGGARSVSGQIAQHAADSPMSSGGSIDVAAWIREPTPSISQGGAPQQQRSQQSGGIGARSISRQIAQYAADSPSVNFDQSSPAIARLLSEMPTPSASQGEAPQQQRRQQSGGLSARLVSRQIAQHAADSPMSSGGSIDVAAWLREPTPSLSQGGTQQQRSQQSGGLGARSISRQIAQYAIDSPMTVGESMLEIARQLHEDDEVQSAPQRGTRQPSQPASRGQLVSLATRQPSVRPSSQVATEGTGYNPRRSVSGGIQQQHHQTYGTPQTHLSEISLAQQQMSSSIGSRQQTVDLLTQYRHQQQQSYGTTGSGHAPLQSLSRGTQYGQVEASRPPSVRPSSQLAAGGSYFASVASLYHHGATFGAAGGTVRPSSFVGHQSGQGGTYGGAVDGSGVVRPSSQTAQFPLPESLPSAPTQQQQQSHQQSGQQQPPTSDAQTPP